MPILWVRLDTDCGRCEADCLLTSAIGDGQMVHSSSAAIAILRKFHFELVIVVGDEDPESAWRFARFMRVANSKQRWIVILHKVNYELEPHARSLGALLVLDQTASLEPLHELLAALGQPTDFRDASSTNVNSAPDT